MYTTIIGRTAGREMSVKILLTVAQQCRNNLYKSRTDRSNGVGGLQSRPTYNKLVHSATTRSTEVGVIHELTTSLLITPIHRRLGVAKFFTFTL